jgi:NAD(P)-dependent dehydrogenase (short-subunit alcohol dehydrogenase family)
MQKLAGKAAVVTGASKGIGAAIAKRMSEQGAAVVVNSSSSAADAERVVREIGANDGKAFECRPTCPGARMSRGCLPQRTSFSAGSTYW